jgi:hypothetical protein
MRLILRAIGAVLLLVAVVNRAQATSLIHSYDLTNSYADIFGGPSLVPNGGTLVAGTGYVFDAGQSLSLSNALPGALSGNYAIEMDVALNTAAGTSINNWSDLLNFINSDNELYEYCTTQTSGSCTLNFFPYTYGADYTLQSGAFADILFNRDGTTQISNGYVNGVLETTFTDTANEAVFSQPNNLIQFFLDDTVLCGSTCENSGGIVTSIKIYDGPETPVPEPTTLTLLGTGLVALAGKLRKRRV